MTREQIEAHLVNEMAIHQSRLDLLNKVAEAVAECRHHASPSKKIATAFHKSTGYAYNVFWDVGNQDKHERRRLKVWGNGVKNDHAIEISACPDKFTWEFVFDSLRQQEGWITKYIEQINGDMEKIDQYIEWDRITKLSIAELEKDRPEASGYLRRCFGEVTVHDNPASPR